MTTTTRQDLIEAALPFFEEQGWTTAALKACCAEKELNIADFEALFPEGIDHIITYIHDDVSAQMIAQLEQSDLSSLKVSERILKAVMLRFKLMAPYKKAFYAGRKDIIKRILLASKTLFSTADAIWYGIGDDTTDFNFYTKRLSLATIYAPTFTYWLSDESEDLINTHMFFERRLENLSVIPKTKSKISKFFAKIPGFFIRK